MKPQTAIHRGVVLLAITIALLLGGCARKLPPPNPDRFAPHLVEVQTVHQYRVDLIFDEAIQSRDLTRADFSIVNAHEETLKILAAASGTEATTITLLTERQLPTKYTIRGIARDLAANPVRFNRVFVGSSRPDTVPPVITSVYPRPYAVRNKRNIAFTFTFSKPVDTLSLGDIWILPASLKARVSREWNAALNGIRFRLTDSLGADTLVSFILPPRLRDFTGNQLRLAGYTSLTADSVLPVRSVAGRLMVGGRAVPSGYVILSRESPLIASVCRDDGSFSVMMDSGTYAVTAVADTNRDGRADLITRLPLAQLPDTLNLILRPDPQATPLDSLFR